MPLPGVSSVTRNSTSLPGVSAGAVADLIVADDEPTVHSVSKNGKKPRAKSAGPRPPMKMQENRDYLSTEEFAAVMGVQPNINRVMVVLVGYPPLEWVNLSKG